MTISPEDSAYINAHRQEDIRMLALKGTHDSRVNLTFCLNQIKAWQKARTKLPLWAAENNIIFPATLSMEQCSSQLTAENKLDILQKHHAGGTLTDLTGGFGVDFTILSQLFQHATYGERQPELFEVVTHNLHVMRNKPELNNTVCEDGISFLQEMKPVDWLFLDPARRNQTGNKVVALNDCEPDVSSLYPLLLQKAGHVLIKLSPMLDPTLAIQQLSHVQEVHVVSVCGECKELLILLSNGPESSIDDIPITCTNISHNGENDLFVFTRKEARNSPCPYTSQLSPYLSEPNASMLKAGGFRSIANRFSLQKLHPNSHLYTSARLIGDFPGRRFLIQSACPFGKKELKSMLAGIEQANITTRNFPENVATLRNRLRLAEGGDTYLFATTLNNGQKTLIRCQAISSIDTDFCTRL